MKKNFLILLALCATVHSVEAIRGASTGLFTKPSVPVGRGASTGLSDPSPEDKRVMSNLSSESIRGASTGLSDPSLAAKRQQARFLLSNLFSPCGKEKEALKKEIIEKIKELNEAKNELNEKMTLKKLEISKNSEIQEKSFEKSSETPSSIEAITSKTFSEIKKTEKDEKLQNVKNEIENYLSNSKLKSSDTHKKKVMLHEILNKAKNKQETDQLIQMLGLEDLRNQLALQEIKDTTAVKESFVNKSKIVSESPSSVEAITYDILSEMKKTEQPKELEKSSIQSNKDQQTDSFDKNSLIEQLRGECKDLNENDCIKWQDKKLREMVEKEEITKNVADTIRLSLGLLEDSPMSMDNNPKNKPVETVNLLGDWEEAQPENLLDISINRPVSGKIGEEVGLRTKRLDLIEAALEEKDNFQMNPIISVADQKFDDVLTEVKREKKKGQENPLEEKGLQNKSPLVVENLLDLEKIMDE